MFKLVMLVLCAALIWPVGGWISVSNGPSTKDFPYEITSGERRYIVSDYKIIDGTITLTEWRETAFPLWGWKTTTDTVVLGGFTIRDR